MTYFVLFYIMCLNTQLLEYIVMESILIFMSIIYEYQISHDNDT